MSIESQPCSACVSTNINRAHQSGAHPRVQACFFAYPLAARIFAYNAHNIYLYGNAKRKYPFLLLCARDMALHAARARPCVDSSSTASSSSRPISSAAAPRKKKRIYAFFSPVIISTHAHKRPTKHAFWRTVWARRTRARVRPLYVRSYVCACPRACMSVRACMCSHKSGPGSERACVRAPFRQRKWTEVGTLCFAYYTIMGLGESERPPVCVDVDVVDDVFIVIAV